MDQPSVNEQNGRHDGAPSQGSPRRAEAAERAHVQHMPEAQGKVRAHLSEDRRRRMELARYVATVEERLSFVADACTSIYEWLLRCGVSSREAVEIRDLGRALRVSPEVAVRVENGSMTIEAAGCVGRALSNPALQRPGDDWLALGTASAQNRDPIKTIRRLLRKREEEAAQKKITVPITLEVTDEVRDVFERARILASRKANQTLTPGQTLGVVSTFYVQHNDPLEVKPGTRRMGPVDVNPDGASGSRTIPAEVMRLVRQRAGDRCEVPGCPNKIHLELCHLTPHAEGGGREAWLLFLFCTGHHWMYDNGLIFFRGTISADGTRIEGVFLDAHGVVLGATPQTEAPARDARPEQGAQIVQSGPQTAETPQVAPAPQLPPIARGAPATTAMRFASVPQDAPVPAADAETAAPVNEILPRQGDRLVQRTDYREPEATAVPPLGNDEAASAPGRNAAAAHAPAAEAPAPHAPTAHARTGDAPAAAAPAPMPERADDGSSVVAEAADATRGGASITGHALPWDARSARSARHAPPRCGVRGPSRRTRSWTKRAGTWSLPSGP
jgi:hypothetical protein